MRASAQHHAPRKCYILQVVHTCVLWLNNSASSMSAQTKKKTDYCLEKGFQRLEWVWHTLDIFENMSGVAPLSQAFCHSHLLQGFTEGILFQAFCEQLGMVRLKKSGASSSCSVEWNRHSLSTTDVTLICMPLLNFNAFARNRLQTRLPLK